MRTSSIIGFALALVFPLAAPAEGGVSAAQGLRRLCAKDAEQAKVRRDLSLVVVGKDAKARATLAGRVAASIGTKVYRIDLSQVVNKYIGETEKNLWRSVATASREGKLLFFDEADALFGKRTGVRAQQRRANLSPASFLRSGAVVLFGTRAGVSSKRARVLRAGMTDRQLAGAICH